jgi:hypothetical protein
MKAVFLVLVAFIAGSGALPAQDRIEPPVAETEVQPAYPADLKSFLVELSQVEMVVDTQGVPFSLRSSASLPDNVVQALAKWRFRPARRNGVAVAYRVTIRVPIHRPMEEMAGRTRRSWSPSKELSDAFAAAKDLDAAKASQLEQSLLRGPFNPPAHLTLLRYSATATDAGAGPMRLRQLLWFVKNQPDSEVLDGPLATPDLRTDTAAEEYKSIREMWIERLGHGPQGTAVLTQATNFLRLSDPLTAEAALLPLIDQVGDAAVFLGNLYGLAALGATSLDPITGSVNSVSETRSDAPFASKARTELGKTGDLRILFSGLYVVSEAGPYLAKAGQLPASYRDFCEQLLARATEHDPQIRANCDAKPLPPVAASRIRIGGNVQQAKLVKKPIPKYPPEARSHGITGVIDFNALIGKDGMIQSLELLEGPLPLYQSARDAVSRWQYKPTLLNGEPVGVVTRIDVNYK